MTFIIHASKEKEEPKTTFRTNVATAVAKGRQLAEDGFVVFITDPDGTRHRLDEFDKLLMFEKHGRR